MKVIINVNPQSNYAYLNGLSFNAVGYIANTVFTLDVNGVLVDFSFAEVIIQDFQELYKKAYEGYNNGVRGLIQPYRYLTAYAKYQGISLSQYLK